MMLLLLVDGVRGFAVCIVVGLIIVALAILLYYLLYKKNGGLNDMSESQEGKKEQVKQKSHEGRKQARQEKREGRKQAGQEKREGRKQAGQEKLRKKDLKNRVHELEDKLKIQEGQITCLKQEIERVQESERKSLIDDIGNLLSGCLEQLRGEIRVGMSLKNEEFKEILEKLDETEFLRQSNQALRQKEADWQTERRNLSDSVKFYTEKSEKYGENISKIINSMSEFLSRWNDACAELKVDAMVSSSCDTTEDVCRILSNEVSRALDQMKESCDAQKSLQEKMESLTSKLETIAASPKQIDNAEYGEWWRSVEGRSYSLLVEIKKSMNYAVLIVDEDVREQSYRDINERIDRFLNDVAQEDLRRRT